MKNEKIWYKTWWGILVILALWPFLVIWWVWTKSGWGNNLKVGISVSLVVLFVGAGLFSLLSGEQATRQTIISDDNIQTTQIMPSSPSPTPTPTQNTTQGTDIARDNIVKELEESPFGFVFDFGQPVNGEENYVGKSGGNVVQLIGPASNLTMLQIVALLTDEEAENLLSLGRVTGFANLIDEASVDWVSDNFEKAAQNRARDFTETEIFNGKVFTFSYLHKDMFDSVTLKVE